MRYKQKRLYTWNPDIAYVVGLITADGCLSKDNRHVDFTSKDRQLAELYRDIIRPGCHIGTKSSGTCSEKLYYRVQFGDVALYDFLLKVGLSQRKSCLLKELDMADCYFADFLRGYFDGDGTITASVDKRWRNSYMFYTAFASASPIFLAWVQTTLTRLLPDVKGHIRASGHEVYQLSYAKAGSYGLFDFMYYDSSVPRLERKYERYLEIFARNPYPIQS